MARDNDSPVPASLETGAGAPDAEMTPEMIAAGMEQLMLSPFYEGSELSAQLTVRDVYRAIQEERRKSLVS
jgi:hypothetical protein